MREWMFINLCEEQAKTPKALFASYKVNRMIRLAGCPKGYEMLLDGKFVKMEDEMLKLVDLARKRAARPARGIPISVGKAYRDVNGEVRFVTDMPPHERSYGVRWASTYGGDSTGNYMRLPEFQEWALEEVVA